MFCKVGVAALKENTFGVDASNFEKLMKNNKFCFLSGILALALMGCAAPIPVSGNTRAGDTLKSDVSRQLAMEAHLYTKCERIDSVTTEVLKTNAVGSGKTPASLKYGSVEERWTVALCGQRVPFQVTLTPDGEGGTYFLTSREKQ